MSIGDFNAQEKLLNIKSVFSLFLKKLRTRIIKEEKLISSVNSISKIPILKINKTH